MPQFFTPIASSFSLADGGTSTDAQSRSASTAHQHGSAPIAPPATVLGLLDGIEVALDAIRGAERNLQHARALLLTTRSEIAMIQSSQEPVRLHTPLTDGISLSMNGSQGAQVQSLARGNHVKDASNHSMASASTINALSADKAAFPSILTQPDVPVSPSASFRSSLSYPDGFSDQDDALSRSDLSSKLATRNHGLRADQGQQSTQEESRPSSYGSGVSSVWHAVFDRESNDQQSAHQTTTADSYGPMAESSRAPFPAGSENATMTRPAIQASHGSSSADGGPSPTGLIQRFYSPRLVTARDSFGRSPSLEKLGPAVRSESLPLKEGAVLLPRQSEPDMRTASQTGPELPPKTSEGGHGQHVHGRAGSMSSAGVPKAPHPKWWTKTVEKITHPRRHGSRECSHAHGGTQASGTSASGSLKSSVSSQEYASQNASTEFGSLASDSIFTQAVVEVPSEEEDEAELNSSTPVGTSSNKAVELPRSAHPWAQVATTPANAKAEDHAILADDDKQQKVPSALISSKSEVVETDAEAGRTSYDIRRDVYRQSAFFGSIADYSMSPASNAAIPSQLDMVSPTLPLSDLLLEGDGVEATVDRAGTPKASSVERQPRQGSSGSLPSRAGSRTSMSPSKDGDIISDRRRASTSTLTYQRRSESRAEEVFGYRATSGEGLEDASDVLQLFLHGSMSSSTSTGHNDSVYSTSDYDSRRSSHASMETVKGAGAAMDGPAGYGVGVAEDAGRVGSKGSRIGRSDRMSGQSQDSGRSLVQHTPLSGVQSTSQTTASTYPLKHSSPRVQRAPMRPGTAGSTGEKDSMTSSSPLTPFKTLFRPDSSHHSGKATSSHTSMASPVLVQQQLSTPSSCKATTQPSTPHSNPAHEDDPSLLDPLTPSTSASSTSDSFGFSTTFGGSPLPKWEDRDEVNDWIWRKTRERGIRLDHTQEQQPQQQQGHESHHHHRRVDSGPGETKATKAEGKSLGEEGEKGAFQPLRASWWDEGE